jgi:hypothetical protein
MEVAGAGVIAGTFPGFQYLLLGGPGEGSHGRKSANETFVVRQRLGDPGLLKEHFGDPDPVRRPVPTPRKRTPVMVEPSEERPHARVVDLRRARPGGTRTGIHRLASRTTRL